MEFILVHVDILGYFAPLQSLGFLILVTSATIMGAVLERIGK